MCSLYKNDFDARIIYMFAFSNASTQKLSVVAGQCASETLNVTINATSSSPAGNMSLLVDNTNFLTTFSPEGNGTIQVNMTYTVGSRRIVERIFVNVSTSNFAAGFFDISLRSEGFEARSKDIYERTW
jgi:hypothetical protein